MSIFRDAIKFEGPVEFGGATTFGPTATGFEQALVIPNLSLYSIAAANIRIASPFAGEVVRVQVTVNSAMGSGAATVTGSIGATPITNGAATVPSASATGTVVTVEPTAARTVALGSVIRLAVGGSQSDEGATASVTITIRKSA